MRENRTEKKKKEQQQQKVSIEGNYWLLQFPASLNHKKKKMSLLSSGKYKQMGTLPYPERPLSDHFILGTFFCSAATH